MQNVFANSTGKLRKNKTDQRMRTRMQMQMRMGMRMRPDGRTMARACQALEACTGIFIYLYIVFYNHQQAKQHTFSQFYVAAGFFQFLFKSRKYI